MHYGLRVCSSPDLVCRISGTLYPWNVAAPMVLGMLAFGGSWEQLIHESVGVATHESGIMKGSSASMKVFDLLQELDQPHGGARMHSAVALALSQVVIQLLLVVWHSA